MDKPPDLFDRAWEWNRLAAFVEDPSPRPTLGIVSGRRRQGKSVLLRALGAATGGFVWQAFEGSRPDQLADLGAALGRHLGTPPLALPDWGAALAALDAVGRPGPTPVILDELPYAAHVAPELPSLLQRRLAEPGSRTRWILCGSAMRVMGGLLAGEAPLRGRAGLELVVLPFDHATARAFWGINDPRTALKVFAVAGGTPAYAREFVRSDAPTGPEDFDDWVCRTALDPSVPLFREARVLLAEDDSLVDRALYHAVLAAIAAGETAPSRIAGRLGRPVTALGHALGVLCDVGLVARHPDAFHPRRATYEIAEPLLRFHHAVLRPSWAVLERPGRQREVWALAATTFAARVVGPVFEEVCRAWTLRHAASSQVGGVVATVTRGVVHDARARTRHELDVVARDVEGRIVAIGEAKWGRAPGRADADRLRHLRALLVAAGHPADQARLLLFTGTDRQGGPRDPDARLITLAELYAEQE